MTIHTKELKQFAKKFEDTGYKVEFFSGGIGKVIKQACIEIQSTGEGTNGEGYNNCSWILVAIVDNQERIAYISDKRHDGVDYDHHMTMKWCEIHDCAIFNAYNIMALGGQCLQIIKKDID